MEAGFSVGSTDTVPRRGDVATSRSARIDLDDPGQPSTTASSSPATSSSPWSSGHGPSGEVRRRASAVRGQAGRGITVWAGRRRIVRLSAVCPRPRSRPEWSTRSRWSTRSSPGAVWPRGRPAGGSGPPRSPLMRASLGVGRRTVLRVVARPPVRPGQSRPVAGRPHLGGGGGAGLHPCKPRQRRCA